MVATALNWEDPLVSVAMRCLQGTRIRQEAASGILLLFVRVYFVKKGNKTKLFFLISSRPVLKKKRFYLDAKRNITPLQCWIPIFYNPNIQDIPTDFLIN